MHYDITKLSDSDAQIVGEQLNKRLIRLDTLIKHNENNLEYQKSHGRGLNGLVKFVEDGGDDNHWDIAAKETQERLEKFYASKREVERILSIMTA